MKRNYHIYIALALLLTGCSTADDMDNRSTDSNPQELTGIRTQLVGGPSQSTTRGTVTQLEDYVGRRDFKDGDQVVFT